MQASNRVPLPLGEILSRLEIDAAACEPVAALARVTVETTVLEEFKPLFTSLEWRLAAEHWNRAGVLLFAEGAVPFAINNSGRLSEAIAALVFEHCRERAAGRGLRVLELGAGCGLFARYFLDAFVAVCAQAGRDYAADLVYFVTDGSQRSVDDWAERDLFAPHGDRVVSGVCDAREPVRVQTRGGEIALADIDLVIANYILDVLPAGIIRGSGTDCQELWVRTHFPAEAVPGGYGVTAADLKRWAGSDQAEDRERLLAWLSFFEYESDFRPNQTVPAARASQALSFAGGLERVFVNWGAFDCLEACARILGPDGIILVHDYGPTRMEDIAAQAASQRFGSTLALGVNFPLLERAMTDAGLSVVAPPGDDELPIHSRLVHRAAPAATLAAYQDRFSKAAYDYFDRDLGEARTHLAAGRFNDALESYRLAVTRNPRDWYVLGEAAEFVALQLRDFAAGVELARAAVERNPWYSTWLWNVLGDALFCLERYDAAHEAYLQAARIDADDVRTNLDLAYTLEQRGKTEEALIAIARGLAHDRRGLFRDRLLEKQQSILANQSARWLGEQERIARRMSRLMQ